MQPFSNVKNERLYRFHKLYAESYVTNLRNLEAPWKPVIASLLEEIVQKVCITLGSSIDVAVQQEQPLAPPALTTASINADSTMTSSKHKGTVYPDISVLRYLLGVNNFRTLTCNNMGHQEIDYLVCAELKRSIKRAYIRQGLKAWNTGYKALLDPLRNAAVQAKRQAFVAMKRPGQTNSDIILIAAVGPFWMWCLANRSQLFDTFRGHTVEDILDDTQEAREDDILDESELIDDADDESSESFTPVSSALLSPMSKEQIFRGHRENLHWSDPVMLDTELSEAALRALLQTLITVIRK